MTTGQTPSAVEDSVIQYIKLLDSFGRDCFKSNLFLQPLKALGVCSVSELVQCCIIRHWFLIQLVSNLEWEGGLAIQPEV